MLAYHAASLPIMNMPMESEFGDHELGRPNEASSLSHRMDFTRVAKVELSSPGPATPMQATPLLQQKPRETSKSCTISPTTSVTHAFRPAKTLCDSQLVSRPQKSLSASTQDPTQSQKENALLLTPSNQSALRGSQPLQKNFSPLPAVHRVGHPSLSRALATLGTPARPLLKDEVQNLLPSKATHDTPSLANSGVIDLASPDKSITQTGRLGLNSKGEIYRYSLDAGLSLGSHTLQNSGSNERPCGEVTRVWESGARSGSQNRLSYAPTTPNEGVVVLQLSQGGVFNVHGEVYEENRGHDWKGKHLQESFSSNLQDGNVDADADHRLTQVHEHEMALCVEHSANPSNHSTSDRSKKRVKREMIDTRISFNTSREQIWEVEEDQDSKRNGNYEENLEVLGSSFFRSGAINLPPQSSREKVLDKVLAKVLEVPSSEPKTVVVKKTPKRVHNSYPSSLSTRSDIVMLEGLEFDNMKSPQSIPHQMFTSSITPGMDGGMFASDLANSIDQPKGSKSQSLVGGQETTLDSSQGAQDGSGIQQTQLDSRLDTVSACSLMSTSKHALSEGEPSLPLSLNFSPKPHRTLVPISRTSTGLPSTEEEWGKSLALCGPGADSPSEVECSTLEPKPLSYQDRFVQLQVFLKKCDEDDQSYLLHALRSLSAAARSSQAVGLEQRAMWLSVEEGKEMARLKSLNVMGQRINIKGQNDVGTTPQGARVPAFLTAADYSQQQMLMNLRSPPRMQMLMSGSMPASAYSESCYSA